LHTLAGGKRAGKFPARRDLKFVHFRIIPFGRVMEHGKAIGFGRSAETTAPFPRRMCSVPERPVSRRLHGQSP